MLFDKDYPNRKDPRQPPPPRGAQDYTRGMSNAEWSTSKGNKTFDQTRLEMIARREYE
jgi:hypothetical protein